MTKSAFFSFARSYSASKASNSKTSSASKKYTYSPFAKSSPQFLAEEGPPFSLSTTVMLS